MCGIAGYLSFSGVPDLELVRRMLGRLKHRGPDGSGLYRDRRVVLGHTRLSIVDLAGGAQPMVDDRGTVWISFNGEIFNFIELREELRAVGHRFRTQSDTEVILHAWKQWGLDAFRRFNGQWAIALWEPAEERLVLSRDRMGIQPLYTARTPRGLLFASEVKALFADPSVERAVDPLGLDQILTFWSVVAPQTPFSGVRQVRPGHCVVIDSAGERDHRFWSLEFPDAGSEPYQHLSTNAQRLRDVLETSARVRFERSDVPVGAYLSGGLDSSITASVVAAVTSQSLHTFSLRFADREFDEGTYQHELIRRLGTEHHEVVVRSRDIADVFPDVVYHAESPLLRSAPAPMFLLSRLVREHGFKVVVTGEGADEVLAGYDIFREGRLRQFWLRNPASAVRGQALSLLYPWLDRHPNVAPAFAHQFFTQDLRADDPALSHRPRWSAASVLKHMLVPEMKATAADAATELVDSMPEGSAGWDPLARAQWLEATTLLPGFILSSQGDRMLMANSVEGRFPFLDDDLVALAGSIPARHKLMGLDEKHVLKRAFEHLIPEEIIRRPKQPYRAPDAAAFFSGGEPPDWVSEVLSSAEVKKAGVFNPRSVDALVAKCRRTEGMRMSNTDNMRALGVISTQLVHQQFIVDAGRNSVDEEPVQPCTVIDTVLSERRTP